MLSKWVDGVSFQVQELLPFDTLENSEDQDLLLVLVVKACFLICLGARGGRIASSRPSGAKNEFKASLDSSKRPFLNRRMENMATVQLDR